MSKPGEYDKYGRLIQEDGCVIIPGTRRPDGTWRKDTRVKPDYMPPDEQVKYESKGSRIARERKEAGVPGLPPGANKAEPKLSKNQKKNIRKKQQKADGTASTNDDAELSEKLARVQVADDKPPEWLPGGDGAQGGAESTEKKIKNLQKKIRQGEELAERVSRGDVEPSTEQQDKIARLPQLRSELEALVASP